MRNSILRWSHLLAIPAFLALAPSVGSAQQQPAFNVNRFRPAERGSTWFASDSLDTAPYLPFVLGTTFDWAHRPLSVYNGSGDRIGDIVRDQYYLHFGAALTVVDRLRIGVNVPIALSTTGDTWSVGPRVFSAGRGGGAGDLRVGVDYRFWGERGDALRLALSVQTFLPTGTEGAYATDRVVRIYPRLLAAGDVGAFVWAVSGGTDFRTRQERFDGITLGSDLAFTASAGVKLGGVLVVGPELYGVSRMASNKVFTSKGTPLEVILGAHYALSENVSVGAAAGPGLSSGFGAPASRVLLSIDYAPGSKPPPVVQAPPDADHDGILDQDDACPTDVGVRSADPKLNGCPLPKDTDGDGIIDEKDACPTEVGAKSSDPAKNGCPLPRDSDNDSIIDEQDACPTEAGVATDDPKTNGCPAPKDGDGDGILDKDDACPDKPGPTNTDAKLNGCPIAVVVNNTIVIMERVEFDNNKATLRPDSNRILEAVLAVLQAHKEIEHVTVEGHTDNHGAAPLNQKLSQNRALSVVKWLVEHGVDAKRLTGVGRGQTKPIDDNNTEEGRKNNRRVEFHIDNSSKQGAVK